jgi:hypothetical protein
MDFLERNISSFIHRFAKDITIQLNPNLVTFYRESRIVQSKPFLYISEEHEKPKVLGWGENYSGTEQSLKINVFDFQDTAKYIRIKPIDCLIAFFRYGIREVTDKKAFIRPKIYVHGLYSLDGTWSIGVGPR